jgi:N-acetylglutamate synthase-like GNAT family acetyltransferase
MKIAWCTDRNEIDRLAAFFARNVTRSYISHSELQFGRAETPDKWIDDLVAQLRAEIAERIPYEFGAPTRVAAAYKGDELVGIAYLTFNSSVPIPFIVIEDIVVDADKRGGGIGQEMINWIFAQARKDGIKRAFLESGRDNHDAHHFFEENGFRQVSVVMMADLDEM